MTKYNQREQILNAKHENEEKTSDSVLTHFSSASDVAATTKSETLSSGWRQSVYRAKLISSRSELGNTPSWEWA
jgi:hypothetical protein